MKPSVIYKIGFVIFYLISCFNFLFAAPLFPDVSEVKWAKDSVADLSVKGIIEGYNDGTFKGDRAITRMEMALMLQRTLSRIENQSLKLADKRDIETLKALTFRFKDELSSLGIRIRNIEENVAVLEKRTDELERITFEGDVFAKIVTIGLRNTGRTDTAWAQDVGGINGINFYRGHKFGTINLINGRPLVNGVSYTGRTRLCVGIKSSKDVRAGLRIASYSSLGDQYIDAYWGINAPYLSNNFAGNSSGIQSGMNNQPWTKMSFDSFFLDYKKGKLKLTAGSIDRTGMNNFILSKVPNPNVSGKNIADFTQITVTDKKQGDVKTLKYFEDEETYLPFFGMQLRGKARIFTDMEWEALASKLPFGPNPTAGQGQPVVNDVTYPYMFGLNGKWMFNKKGSIRLNFLQAKEYLTAGNSLTTIPNHGNYWFWSDPAGYSTKSASARPMRSNSFVSRQKQTVYGVDLRYRFEPSSIRTIAAYAGSSYKPNRASRYSAKGNHFRLGVGWTNRKNNFSLDLEYISTDPYYDAFQSYFQPIGAMALGGVPPGTPVAFAVVPAYFGGFPGSYIPFGYQLHDSGLYPNNRSGIRFDMAYRFPENKSSLNVRGAYLKQLQATVPHRTTDGTISGMKPGFIDPVFHPLYTDGNTVFESPKGRQLHLGCRVDYAFNHSLKGTAQYDYYHFMRDSLYAGNTVIAMNNYVDLTYRVMKTRLQYNVRENFKIKGGYDYSTIKGYHPSINTLILADAGTNIVNVRQLSPYIGFDYELSDKVNWNAGFRWLNTKDNVPDDGISPESFKGHQLMTELKIKF